MTAASIVEYRPNADYQIEIFESNAKLGRKLVISGGGRCNITTGVFEKKLLSQNYVRGWDFLKSSIGLFGPKKCKIWFENHNLPLKIQEDMRIFPISDNGDDVLGIFEKIIHEKKILVHYKTRIENIEKRGNGFQIITKDSVFDADIIVLATGGNAYAHTGSRGDGYHFAQNLGHTITQL